ncbi:hypothetical protein [Mycobacterium arosiense]|uniref:CAP domain-containing protein n=1 Tax=Mycobacterium arosiense ATCC BAA-1401 = DSM 45069 TaxID=1265311 RepID=A0A1W9ZB43_MYCAI|nr:hypothetical protein [Mycobacterium arosiense]ORA10372.1 hypothetical protein BST14_20520 [Mycobacterium arosiense ATCC BAA-1401 = DSM 45069]
MAIVTVVPACIVLAPAAVADQVAATFRDAVASLRSGTSCGPLQDNSAAEQAADIINRSTDAYLNHTATHVPISDPLPGLKDLGYPGNKAVLLQGAHKNPADAIKGALLEGHAAIPDCSYTDFGVSMFQNETSGYNLTAAVLAGP